MKCLCALTALLLCTPPAAFAREAVPDKLVVLTFDDSVKSHFTVVRPILKRYGIGATFFITEGFSFATNKNDYMTWDEIAQLHKDGFEIGNHTRDHMGVKAETLNKLPEQLDLIDKRCADNGLPKPVSFAWPGNGFDIKALPILTGHGIRFARRGGAPEYPYEKGRGFAFEPGKDHPLLLPTAGDARPDWTLEDFRRAADQAKGGRIAILQFHGVPDNEHPWVHTPPERFEQYMKYLHDNAFKVIALRDLARYVDPDDKPADPLAVIKHRQATLQSNLAGQSRYIFTDSSLIESAKGFAHTMNPATRIGQVVRPDKPWEYRGVWAWVSVAEYNGAYHMWYDAVDQDGRWSLCYATSADGLTWTKPQLNLIDYKGSTANNIVYLGRPGGQYHGGTVFIDPHGEPAARFKFVYGGGPTISTYGHMGVDAAVSPDGIHFAPGPICPITPWYTDCGNVAFWDDQRNTYVLYVRYWTGRIDVRDGRMTLEQPFGKRAVGRTESADFFHFPRPRIVLQPDAQDPPDLEMYNSAAHKYAWARDAYLIFTSAFYLTPDTLDVQIAAGRDGINWRRDFRAPFLRVGPAGAFDSMEIYMGHGMLLRGDQILMYYGGYNIPHGKTNPGPGIGGVGCCTIRKDGFFSMDAAYSGGEMTTLPILVDAPRLSLNLDASAGGSLRVEVQDDTGKPVPGLTAADTVEVRGNRVDHLVTWKQGADLSPLVGRKAKLRFIARDCKLYAFAFMSPTPTSNPAP